MLKGFYVKADEELVAVKNQNIVTDLSKNLSSLRNWAKATNDV
jgi:hypothetical protein